MFMKGTDRPDEKTTVMYVYDQKRPLTFYCRLDVWDFIDIGILNSFIFYQKIVQTKFHKSKEDKIIKTQKDFKRAVANVLIENFSSKKKNCFKIQARTVNRRHRIGYAKKHERCSRCYVQDKLDQKVFARYLKCNVICV